MQEISNIKRDLRIVSRPPEVNKEIDVIPLPTPWKVSLTQTKVTIFLIQFTKHDAIDIADLSSMQDVCHIWTLLTIESLRLCGRASEHGIRRSEVHLLMGTRNVFFVPRSWQDEITTFSNSLPGSELTIFLILFKVGTFLLGGIWVFFFWKKVLALPCI